MNATIWVTTACNLDCKYCYEGHNKSNQFMDINIANQTVEYIIQHMQRKRSSHLSITFHGGEPLLAFDIIKYIIRRFSSISSLKIEYIMTTNAIGLSDDISKYLADNFSQVSVSLDGDLNIHNKNRIFPDGRGTYNAAFTGAMHLMRYMPNVRARMTINPDTVCGTYNSIYHLIINGFKYIDPIIDIFDNRWTDESMEEYKFQLKQIADFIYLQNHNVEVGALLSAERKLKNNPCDGGYSSLHIMPNGNIFPCVYSVNNQTYCIGDIWSSVNMQKVQKIADLNMVINVDCVGCTRYHYCSATRCKLINKIVTGNPHKSFPMVCAVENASTEVNLYVRHIINERTKT